MSAVSPKPCTVGTRSVESEHHQERGVDLPLLIDCDPADLIAETSRVDGADLLDEDACALASDVERWSKRRGPSARRRRGHEHNGPRQHGVGLDNDAQMSAALLMPDSLRQAQLVDLAPLHVSTQTRSFSISSATARISARSASSATKAATSAASAWRSRRRAAAATSAKGSLLSG